MAPAARRPSVSATPLPLNIAPANSPPNAGHSYLATSPPTLGASFGSPTSASFGATGGNANGFALRANSGSGGVQQQGKALAPFPVSEEATKVLLLENVNTAAVDMLKVSFTVMLVCTRTHVHELKY